MGSSCAVQHRSESAALPVADDRRWPFRQHVNERRRQRHAYLYESMYRRGQCADLAIFPKTPQLQTAASTPAQGSLPPSPFTATPVPSPRTPAWKDDVPKAASGRALFRVASDDSSLAAQDQIPPTPRPSFHLTQSTAPLVVSFVVAQDAASAAPRTSVRSVVMQQQLSHFRTNPQSILVSRPGEGRMDCSCSSQGRNASYIVTVSSSTGMLDTPEKPTPEASAGPSPSAELGSSALATEASLDLSNVAIDDGCDVNVVPSRTSSANDLLVNHQSAPVAVRGIRYHWSPKPIGFLTEEVEREFFGNIKNCRRMAGRTHWAVSQ